MLFEKEGRRIRLTELGRQFYKCVDSSLSTLDNGIETLKLASKGSGVVRLGILRVMGVAFIPNMIAEFQKAYPENDVVFTIDSDVSQKITDGLENNIYDIENAD